jgi:hypothetical protein
MHIHVTFHLMVIGHAKLLLDLFNVLYANIEDQFTQYMSTRMLQKVVLRTMAVY